MASSIQKTPKFVLSDDTQKLLSENGLGRFISEVQDLCQIVKDVDEHPPPKPKELQQQLEALRDSLENTLRAIDNLSFQAYMKVMCNASARKINMVIWSAKGGSWPLALIGLIGLPDELAGFVSWMPLMIDAVNHNTTRILLILGGVLIALWPWPWRLRSDPPLINVPAWRQFWPTPWRGIGNTLGLVLAVTIIFLLASWFLPDSGWHPSVEKLEETIEEWATNPDHQSTKTLNDIDELTEFQFQLFVDDTIVIAELRKETPNVLRLVTNHPLADRVAGLLL